MDIKNAKGMKGYLIGSFTFVEYGTLKEYTVIHPDLSVIIDDDDAFIKEICRADGLNADGIIDVSDKTLGYKEGGI